MPGWKRTHHSNAGMSKSLHTKPEHWTQRINRENRELKQLNQLLMAEFQKHDSDFIIKVGLSPSTSSDAGGGGYGSGGDLPSGGGDDFPDDFSDGS